MSSEHCPRLEDEEENMKLKKKGEEYCKRVGEGGEGGRGVRKGWR